MDDYIEQTNIKVKKIRNTYPKDIPKKFKQYLITSTNKNILFELSLEQFNDIISKDCVYCGQPNANGIDKVIPKDGYTLNNSVPCCTMCNTMKFTYTVENFIQHINKIYHYNKQ
jgi:5-methylcytosine-specific restriction endonuclease McrA